MAPRVADMQDNSPLTELKRDAFLAMSEEEQEFLRELADKIRIALEIGEAEAGRFLASQTLQMEEELALWYLLPSNVRSAIKRGQKVAK